MEIKSSFYFGVKRNVGLNQRSGASIGGGAYEARRLVPPQNSWPGGTLWSVPPQNFCRIGLYNAVRLR